MIERPAKISDKSVAVWQAYLDEYKRMREEHGFNDDWTRPDAAPPIPMPVVRAAEMEKLHARVQELEAQVSAAMAEKTKELETLDRRWRLQMNEEARIKTELHVRVAALEKENAALRDELKTRVKTFKRIRV